MYQSNFKLFPSQSSFFPSKTPIKIKIIGFESGSTIEQPKVKLKQKHHTL